MGTYRLQRKYREAVQTFLKVKEVDPNEIDFSYHAGVASRLLGDETAANSYFGQFRRDIERRLRSNPEDVAALFDHAIVLARLGDSDRASSLAQTAMELPRSRRSATRSPSLYFPASRYSRETEAPAPDSYFDLGRLLSVQGRTQEATRRSRRRSKRAIAITCGSQ